MLQIRDIHKEYKTGNLTQKALDGVSLNLRENEFVAILGPSGSGKTTLLNIIGGLDRYDSGDLVINGISTKKYRDRDWDSYRNHTIGFVFQSYNLIPHQTVLANVELALTISGVSKRERRKRAKHALEQVGLGDQMHKKPNQMSGGQMQRVAIARALVNDPDILLADEPTGALDTETSMQVMELLKQVAQDRLVVMVTHNPELAEAYATRIVKLRDGRIRADSDPYEIETDAQAEPVHKNMGKASMSFLTALSLSFNNLRTKKARTILTAFAGSIGIIGIALILAMSNGVNNYIRSIEENTLSEYPVQIQGSGVDITAMMGRDAQMRVTGGEGEVGVTQMITNLLSKVDSNDLGSLKAFLDSGESGIEPYVKAVEYSYGVSPQIYLAGRTGVRQVNPDRSFAALGIDAGAGTNSIMSMFMNTDVFHEMPACAALYEGQYDVRAGRWPETYNECVVVLTGNGNISDFMLYSLGLRDSVELDEMIAQFLAEEEVELPEDIRPYTYDELLGLRFKLVNAADYYAYDSEYGVWKDKTGDAAYMRELVENGEDITVVGVVQPSPNATATMLQAGIGYPAALTEHILEQAESSAIVRAQLARPQINVFTGEAFGAERGEFDMGSLISVDEEQLAAAFQFDQSALDIDPYAYLSMDGITIDLSGLLDPGQMELPAPELSQLLSALDISVTPEALGELFSKLLAGYAAYVADDPTADYARLPQAFADYLRSPEAQQILSDRIGAIVAENSNVTVSAEKLASLVRQIMEGFGDYAAENALTDPSQFGEYLQAYLLLPETQEKLAQSAAEILQIGGSVVISAAQLEALSSELTEGYVRYAEENSLPIPGRIDERFAEYMKTPEAQQLLFDAVTQMVDMDALRDALGEAMQGYTSALAQTLEAQITDAMQQVVAQLGAKLGGAMQQMMRQLGTSLQTALQIDPAAFTQAIQMNMSADELRELLMSLMTGQESSYEGNLRSFGYADRSKPSAISIYPRDFESKTAVLAVLDGYNSRMEAAGAEEKVIRYTDFVGTLMSSVTEIVDIISYVLVAFVSIALVVSSIMIGVITYISVLERRKEIGILRAIGASKRNVSAVFNAETFIIGLCAGVIGIGMTLLLIIPCNAIIHSLAGRTDINAALPALDGLILIALSVVLTLLGGLIPSKKAAKCDPVTALRAE